MIFEIDITTIIKDINECDLDLDDCSINANCDNTIGSYICTCKPGFDGTGDSCDGVFSFSFLFLLNLLLIE